jgi:hypothetical protein
MQARLPARSIPSMASAVSWSRLRRPFEPCNPDIRPEIPMLAQTVCLSHVMFLSVPNQVILCLSLTCSVAAGGPALWGLSPVQALRDLAVVDALLRSSKADGTVRYWARQLCFLFWLVMCGVCGRHRKWY